MVERYAANNARGAAKTGAAKTVAAKTVAILGTLALGGIIVFVILRTAANARILDAVDAVDRYRLTGRTTEQVEAMRLVQLAERAPHYGEKFWLLSRYYSAVDMVAKYGDADARTLADVCGAEVRGRQFGNYVPGDCERLGHENPEKAKSELGVK